MGKVYKDRSVLDAARWRIGKAFDECDRAYLAFGGKDSTVLMHLVMDEAIKRQRKIGVMYIDFEAQYAETIRHIQEMFDTYAEHIESHWICMPMSLRNAVTNFEPQWIAWDESKKDLWIRPKPLGCTTEADYPFAQAGMEFEEFIALFGQWYAQGERTAGFIGIRAQESLHRYCAIATWEKRDKMLNGWRWTTKIVDQVYNCQPVGTMVSVVAKGHVGGSGGHASPATWAQKPIEDIQVGDAVASYRLLRSSFVRNGHKVTGVVRRPFSGDLVKVTAGQRVTRFTPEHRCIVGRLGSAFKGHHVYLMRRGDSFRVGRCGAWSGPKGGSGLKVRAKTEGADAVWILKRFDTAKDAAEYEAYVWVFNLPGLTFYAAPNGHGLLDQAALDRFWKSIGDLRSRAGIALEAHGRDIRFPLWTPQVFLARHKSVEVRAANLMDGMEFITDERVMFWEPVVRAAISVEREAYEGDVVSLGVEVDETYVADGFVTHNCYPIYDWLSDDIWTYHAKYPDRSHNGIYDAMQKAGVPMSQQRLCQPFGDDQRRGLWLYHVLEPETWATLVARVSGANSGALYMDESGNISGYNRISKPADHTWESFCNLLLRTMPPATRDHYVVRFRKFIAGWKARGYDTIPDEAPPELEAKCWAPSWRRMCKVLLRNDYWCKGLGQTQPKSAAWQEYKALKAGAREAVDATVEVFGSGQIMLEMAE